MARSSRGFVASVAGSYHDFPRILIRMEAREKPDPVER